LTEGHQVERIERRVRTAAVEHYCDCCRHPIYPGQVYVRIVNVVDGQFATWCYHKGEDDCIWTKPAKGEECALAR